MPKWEYKFVEAGSGTVYMVDRQPLQTPRPLLDAVYLNELGEAGWELVSYDVDHERAGVATVMIFKRPKLWLLHYSQKQDDF